MIEMSNLCVARLLATWSMAACMAASAQPVYHIEPIGVPDESQAAAINNRGTIVGWANRAALFRAALLTEQGAARLLSKEAGETFGKAINEANLVVYDVVLSTNVRGGVWEPASARFRDLGTLGGTYCSAADVDDTGRVVGSSSLPDGRVHAFVTDGIRLRDLGTLGGDESRAAGINNQGQIAGTSVRADGSSHAFIEHDGVMTDLGDLGSGSSEASAINALGHVVGTSNPTGRKGHEHAFLWDGTRMRDLGTLGGKFSYGYGVNRYDEVVGISRFENERDPAQHAFLYSGGTMHSLFDLLDSSREGWGTLINASDINDDGDIVGLGAYQGHQRAYRARRVSN